MVRKWLRTAWLTISAHRLDGTGRGGAVERIFVLFFSADDRARADCDCVTDAGSSSGFFFVGLVSFVCLLLQDFKFLFWVNEFLPVLDSAAFDNASR